MGSVGVIGVEVKFVYIICFYISNFRIVVLIIELAKDTVHGYFEKFVSILFSSHIKMKLTNLIAIFNRHLNAGNKFSSV